MQKIEKLEIQETLYNVSGCVLNLRNAALTGDRRKKEGRISNRRKEGRKKIDR